MEKVAWWTSRGASALPLEPLGVSHAASRKTHIQLPMAIPRSRSLPPGRSRSNSSKRPTTPPSAQLRVAGVAEDARTGAAPPITPNSEAASTLSPRLQESLARGRALARQEAAERKSMLLAEADKQQAARELMQRRRSYGRQRLAPSPEKRFSPGVAASPHARPLPWGNTSSGSSPAKKLSAERNSVELSIKRPVEHPAGSVIMLRFLRRLLDPRPHLAAWQILSCRGLWCLEYKALLA